MQNTRSWRWGLALVALAALVVGGLSAAPVSNTGPEWVFQHEETPPAGLAWDRLGGAYLRQFEWRDLGAKAAPAGASRMVVAERSSPLAAALLAELGLDASGALAIAGGDVGPATGLVITAPDPDGEGRVALFTGEDADGVYQTFTTQVNIAADGWLCVRGRQVVRRGAWPCSSRAS